MFNTDGFDKTSQNLEIAGKAMLTLIPGIGGSIQVIYSGIIAKRKEERLKAFLQDMSDDLDALGERVQQDYIKADDFLDVFEETARKITQERTREKRNAYRRILLHSITMPGIEYDTTEEYLRLLDRLRSDHLFFLGLFYSPDKFNAEHGYKLNQGGGMTTSIAVLLSKLLTPRFSEESILDLCKDLENERLIHNLVGPYSAMMSDQGVNHLKEKLTSKGQDFFSFIVDDF